jgi:hypothetical protein
MIDLLHRGNLRNEEEEEKKKRKEKISLSSFFIYTIMAAPSAEPAKTKFTSQVTTLYPLHYKVSGRTTVVTWILGYLRLCQIIKTQKSREIKTSLPM